MSSEPAPAANSPKLYMRLIKWTAQSVVLFGLWLAFSGHTEPEFILQGVIAATSATALANWLFQGIGSANPIHPAKPYGQFSLTVIRFVLYVPWLIWQIVVSNIHVAWLVLHPRLPINPSLVEFESSLTSAGAQVLLAQSITLTPGTVTVDLANGKFLVHCLSAKSREGLEQASIQTRVANVFSETSSTPVKLNEIT